MNRRQRSLPAQAFRPTWSQWSLSLATILHNSSLNVCLSVSLYACPSVRDSTSAAFFVCRSMYLSVCVCPFVDLCSSLHLDVCLLLLSLTDSTFCHPSPLNHILTVTLVFNFLV